MKRKSSSARKSDVVLKDTSGHTSVQGVPRRITAFVGRLHSDTTEEDLRDMLTSVGDQEPICKKLKVPEGKTFTNAVLLFVFLHPIPRVTSFTKLIRGLPVLN